MSHTTEIALKMIFVSDFFMFSVGTDRIWNILTVAQLKQGDIMANMRASMIKNKWMAEWMTEWMNDWMNDWMTEWLSDWMNEWKQKWNRMCGG